MESQGKFNKRVYRSLIYLAIPTVIEHIMSTLLQYVDTAMVGHLGENATAAVSTTTTINWLAGSIPYALGIAVLASIAKESGAGNTEKTRKITVCACYLTFICGMTLMLICTFLSPYIPIWMNAKSEIRKSATSYFLIISLSMVFRTAEIVFSAAMRAVKNTKTPMLINLLCNVLNIVLNALLIYKMNLGVNGAAIGSAISYTICGIMMMIFARRQTLLKWERKDFRFDKMRIHGILKIAIPAAGNNIASCLGYVIFAGMVSGMGTAVFAAHSIAVTAEELFYIPGYGLRTASSSLIGNAIGEGDDRKKNITAKLSIEITIFMMIISGVILFVFARPLMSIFTNSQRVAELGSDMLKMIAFTEPFFGLMIAIEGIFYGMGKTREVFAVETSCMWGIRIVSAFLCTQVWHLSLYAVWRCMIADNVCKAVILLIVYRIGQRQKGMPDRNNG